MVPTLRLVLLIAAASVPFAAAMVQPGLVRAGVIADVLLVVAVVLDWLVTPKPRELEARIKGERVASLGSPFSVTLEIVNLARTGGLAVARLLWPETWTAESAKARFELAPFGRSEVSFTATPKKRGRFAVGPAWVRYASTLGLFWRDAKVECAAEVKVYPAVASLKKYQLLVRRLRLARRLPA